VDPHIFADLNPGSQNLADPKQCLFEKIKEIFQKSQKKIVKMRIKKLDQMSKKKFKNMKLVQMSK